MAGRPRKFAKELTTDERTMLETIAHSRTEEKRRVERAEVIGICQDTSEKLVRSLFIPEEPHQGLCPYASLPQDIFLT